MPEVNAVSNAVDACGNGLAQTPYNAEVRREVTLRYQLSTRRGLRAKEQRPEEGADQSVKSAQAHNVWASERCITPRVDASTP